MKSLPKIGLFTLTAFLAVGLAFERPVQFSDSANMTLSGKVRDAETRIPIVSARIDVIDAASGDTVLSDARTDSVGFYNVTLAGTGLDDDPYTGDYFLGALAPNPVGPGQPVQVPFSMPLGDSSPPHLELFDVQGRRVPNNSVLAAGQYFLRLRFANGSVTRPRGLTVAAATSPDFRLRQVDVSAQVRSAKTQTAATYRLVVSSRGYQIHEEEISSSVGETRKDVPLQPVALTSQADEVVYDVTYGDQTVVVEGEALETLIEADTVNQVYRFDKAGLDAAGLNLEADKTLFISGVALRKIVAVTEDGPDVVVETAFASLTDAITDGTISWSHSMDRNTVDVSLTTVNGKTGTYDPADASITFKYEVKTDSTTSFTINIKLEPGASDTTMAKMTCQVVRKRDGSPKATMTAKVDLKPMKSNADISIANSELETASYSADDTSLDVELSVAAAGAGLGYLSFKMPDIAIPIRFLVGGVPIKIKVKVQAVLKLVVRQEASATAKTTMRYSGSAGFEYLGTEIELKHSVASYKFGSSEVDAAASIGNIVDVQYGVAFPNLTVDVFGFPIVPELLTGFVIGSQLTWGPICKKGYVRMDVKGGASLKVLGFETKLVDKLLFQERKESECGG